MSLVSRTVFVRMSFALAIGASLLCVGTPAQVVPSWTQLSGGPGARIGHAMAFDAARGRVVLFGGESGGAIGDTWEWDGTAWHSIPVVGPTPRVLHAMAFDSARGRVVLFGGESSASGWTADTWEWDGTAWIPQLLAMGPTARSNHRMAYDSARARTVLFGGHGPANLASYLTTWEWDGTTWLQVSAGGLPGRDSFAMAYDSARSRTVVFGGRSVPGSAVLPPDTWEWDGASWSQVATTGPAPRHLHAMEYDGSGVLLFGGLAGNPVADTWRWDGTSWTSLNVAGPSARLFHAMAFDSWRATVVLFGGNALTVGSTLGDTWGWDAANVAYSVPFGAGCGNPALLLSRVPSAPPRLNATAQANMANVPAALAFVALGVSKTTYNGFPLPVTLAGVGMPGCSLYQSAEVVGQSAVLTSATTATYSLPIPNSLTLIGVHVYLQGWAWAPGANAASVVVSNAMDWRVGL